MMLGKITSIEEVFGDQDYSNNSWFGHGKDGYKVTTEAHSIFVLINNGYNCCESWGYIASDDDFSQFVGAELLSVNLVDIGLNIKMVEAGRTDLGGIQFVNFKTTVGTLQLAVYNSHNGYYGHRIVVAIDEKILIEDVL